MRLGYAAALAVTVLVYTAPAWAQPSPAQKCQGGKNIAAGKYALCRQKAEGKLITIGDVAKYTASITKCTTKFSNKWAKLELAGGCPTTLDEGNLEDQITTHSGVVAWKLSGEPRFKDNGDGTITDRQTQLTWEKKVKLDGSSDYANLHDADNNHPWAGTCTISGNLCQPTLAAAANCLSAVEGNTLGCAICGMGEGTCDNGGTSTAWEWVDSLITANLGGHTDWRLPKLSELESIIDLADGTPPPINVAFHGASCGGACTDITSAACACTQSNGYWSSTSVAASSDSAWGVDFSGGTPGGGNKLGLGYVRAVRGGS